MARHDVTEISITEYELIGKIINTLNFRMITDAKCPVCNGRLGEDGRTINHIDKCPLEAHNTYWSKEVEIEDKLNQLFNNSK